MTTLNTVLIYVKKMPLSARTVQITVKTRAALGFAALARTVQRRNDVNVGDAAQLQRVPPVKSGGLLCYVSEVPCRSQYFT